MSSESGPDLGLFQQIDEDKALQHLKARRRQNLESCRLCWPEWTGPEVADGLAGRCSIGSCSAGHYAAPCRILEIMDDGIRFRVAIDYPPSAPKWVQHFNGKEILLDLADIRPPVDLLWKQRHKESIREAIATGVTCACGGEPAHVFGAGFECRRCREARIPPDE